jgi:hypothetical protein
MNNQRFGTTLPGWIKLTAVTQIDSHLTDEELFQCSSLPPEDQQKVDQAFGSREDALVRFRYAIWWSWPTLDTPTVTAQEAIRRGWCKGRYKSPGKLLAALAKEGYQHDTMALGTCLRLEEIKQERKRHQAKERQARRRARLSPEARAELRVKDLRYRREKRAPNARSSA